jgi:cytoplasmic FMR1 interacting protein
MYYVDSATDVFVKQLDSASEALRKKKIVPEGQYDSMIAAVDVLQQLDKLKDMKACLTNDFSRYKRSLQVVKESLSAEDADELSREQQQLQLFLGNPKYPKRYIMRTLKEKCCQTVPSFEDGLLCMLQRAVDSLWAEAYFRPSDKYTLLRALPHLLVLMDGPADMETSFNAFKHKKFKLSTVQKLLQRYPVVPEFGDMASTLSHALAEAPHFDADSMGSAYGVSVDAKVEAEYSILTSWPRIKDEYNTYTTSLACALNELATEVFAKDAAALYQSGTAARSVLDGLRILGRWSCTLREAIAWKLTHPADYTVEAGGADPSSAYARALKHNFRPDELGAIVEIITMIKSLAGLLSRHESRLAPYIRLYIHHATQQLVQGTLIPVLHRADKKKRGIMPQLLALRTMAADYAGAAEAVDDYKRYKRAQGQVNASVHPRVVGPSATQLQLLRTMVRAFYDDNSELRQGFGMLNREDLKREDLDSLRSFYEASFAFPYLLNLGGTLRDLSDLGDLWFREYHLELTKCIQFPIEMSFPWILTQYIVAPNQLDEGEELVTGKKKSKKKKKKKKGGGESEAVGRVLVAQALYALDLYNDAAQLALYELNSQYLFNEIQAEVNLVYDQLVFHLEAEMYGYYKDWAASTELDKMWKRGIEARRGWGWYTPERWRYEVPIQQRHLLLMGRSVDLNRRFAFDMTQKMQADIEMAVKVFESKGLTGILEFESTIRTIRRTHELLQGAGLGVDSWDSIYAEITEVVSASSIRGRITTHVLTSLLLDLFPNFRFCNTTQRFVRSPVQLKEVGLPSKPACLDKTLGKGAMCSKAFEQVDSSVSDFIGSQHLQCMVSVLSSAELPLVIEGVIQQAVIKMSEVKGWTDQLATGLPPVRLPRYSYGSGGCYAFFDGKVAEFLSYENLKPGVFQDVTELGNMLAFLQCLSRILESDGCLQFIHSLPIVGMSSARNYDKEHTRAMAGIGGVAQVIKGAAGDDAADALLRSAAAGQDDAAAASSTQSLMTTVLQRLDAALDEGRMRADWEGEPPANGVLEVEDTSEFYRIFSALNFVFCMPDAPGVVRDFDQFGDGFALAGTVLIHLLGQREIFELLDFSYHVLNMSSYERSGGGDNPLKIAVDAEIQGKANTFLNMAYLVRCLHFEYFNLVRAAYPCKAQKDREVSFVLIFMVACFSNIAFMPTASLSRLLYSTLQQMIARCWPLSHHLH